MIKSIHVKSVLLGMVICIFGFLLTGAVQQPEEEAGRYQVVTGSTASSVFVLDTRTGAVAKFYLDDFGTRNQVPAQVVKKRLRQDQ